MGSKVVPIVRLSSLSCAQFVLPSKLLYLRYSLISAVLLYENNFTNKWDITCYIIKFIQKIMLNGWFFICALVRKMQVMCLGLVIAMSKTRIVFFLSNVYGIYSRLLIAMLKSRNFLLFLQKIEMEFI